jgi:hypothetical protein
MIIGPPPKFHEVRDILLPDRILIFGERHLRTVLTRYAEHYNPRRPRRALRLVPPRPPIIPLRISNRQRSDADRSWKA